MINPKTYVPRKGIDIEKVAISDLKDKLARLQPKIDPNNEIVKERLENAYDRDEIPVTETSLEQGLEGLMDIIKIQCSDGNWNYDEYMFGLANGMLLSEATLKGTDPIFLNRPKKFIDHKRYHLNIFEKIILTGTILIGSFMICVQIMSLIN